MRRALWRVAIDDTQASGDNYKWRSDHHPAPLLRVAALERLCCRHMLAPLRASFTLRAAPCSRLYYAAADSYDNILLFCLLRYADATMMAASAAELADDAFFFIFFFFFFFTLPRVDA